MKKLMNHASRRSIFIFCFISSLFVFVNMPEVRTEELLSVVGEWEVISVGEYQSSEWIGQKLSISRKGDGYEVVWVHFKIPWMFTGNDTHIVYTEMANLSEFTVATSGTLPLHGVPQQQIPIENCYTLSADGNFLTREQDSVLISSNGGTYTGYCINHGFLKRTLKRISAPSAPVVPTANTSVSELANKSSSDIAQIESRGEFYFLTKDGRKLTGEEASKVSLEEGSKVVTGSTGHVRMTLPDNTTFTVGPNSDLVIDKFVYDPATDSRAITANLSKGVFRWITGKIAHKDPTQMKVTLPVGELGIRGTDFEATVEPDGSGSIVLYFGQLEITEKKTGFKFMLDAGHKVTFSADGSFSRPMELK